MNTISLELRAIFWEALDHPSGAERREYLDRACGGDTGLRSRVEALMLADRNAGDFLESPVLPPTVTFDSPALLEAPGTSIGPYKLMEQIGEGGMGVVYVAEQTRPVRRKVALKVIKPGMDTRQILARFEAERQVLAIMDHPNIAKVHDAGATASGRPYFVMELVKGIPITDYCDKAQLSIRERLDLFVLVCRALQHAHQKGIIHRDLKPSNILVTLIDGVAVPKVIDFGIAKSTGEPLTDGTIYTGFAQLVGTPLYMSPEQAEISGVDVDTRSDIFALGVLLYELLTGTTPIDRETLCKAAYDEIRRVIREQDPPTPSTRLGTLGDTLSSVSANRHSDVRKLGHSVRGELDWIVMKALEKDRNRRYATANDFAADVMRHLTDRPVEACPPSTWYRFTKNARRNRAAFSTAVLVALTFVGGMAASLWQAVRAAAAEHQAVAAQGRAEDQSLLARRAVDELYDQVAVRWLDGLRYAPLPQPFLEKALPFYQGFTRERRVDSSVGQAHRRAGEILIQLGRWEEARQSLKRAVAIFEALLAVDPENPEHIRNLASCYGDQAEGTRDDSFQKKAISLREQLVARHPGVWSCRDELAAGYHGLGVLYEWTLRPNADRAVEQLKRALKIREELCAEHPADAALRSRLSATLRDLGNAYREAGALVEAEPYQRRAHAIMDELVSRYPTRPQYWLQLSWACQDLGRWQVAAQKYKEAVGPLSRAAMLFEGLANENPDVESYRRFLAYTLGDLAKAQFQTGRRDEGEQAIRRLEGLKNDQWAAEQLSYIAGDLCFSDKPEFRHPAEAIELIGRSEKYRPDQSGFAWHVLGVAHYRAGRWDAALRELRRSSERQKDGMHLGSGYFLAMTYHQKGDKGQARTWYNRSVAWTDAHEPKDRFLVQYRAESVTLLGLEPAKGAARPKAPPEPTSPPK